MKARTKLQLDVIQRSKELRNLDNFMCEWVKTDYVTYTGFATKKRAVCMQCGKSFSTELVSRNRAVCPHCSTKLKIEVSRKSTEKQTIYTAYAQTYCDYQVIRYFIHYCYFGAGKQAKINSWEIMQLWVLDNGKHEIVGMNHHVTSYCDTWTGDWGIRKESYSPYNYYGEKYNIWPDKYHPKSEFKDRYTKYGINASLAGLTFLNAIRKIPKNPRLETLLKCKQYQLLNFFSNRTVTDYYWSAIKISIRNKYKVKEPQLWVDYVDLLRYLNKDIHNAKYVCPAKLKKEHDRLVRKKREIQKRLEIERKRKTAQEYEDQFRKLKAHLLGIVIPADKLVIKTLDTVQEYLEEGDLMNHCVFTNEYFLKSDTLCLSARLWDQPNEPLETIELSLKDMKIAQCRGKNNQNTEYHDQILNVVRRNIRIIKQRIINQPEDVQLTK